MSEETRAQLDEASARIMSIAAVHHRLYDGGGFAAEGQVRSGLGMRLVTALAKGKPADAVRIGRAAGHGRVVVTTTL